MYLFFLSNPSSDINYILFFPQCFPVLPLYIHFKWAQSYISSHWKCICWFSQFNFHPCFFVSALSIYQFAVLLLDLQILCWQPEKLMWNSFTIKNSFLISTQSIQGVWWAAITRGFSYEYIRVVQSSDQLSMYRHNEPVL